ncbi:MAG: sterol desaturase family protein [Flavobacteriales bacterium]
MAKRNVNGGGRLFQSPVLEALTRTHIAFPLVIFYTTGAVAIWWVAAKHVQPAMVVGVLALAGLCFFSWVEYTVHRRFYHMGTNSPRKARIQYIFHGVHHDHPRDKRRLALPPVMSVLVAASFVGMFRLLLGPLGLAFGGGFLAGYATYLAIHYAIHVFPPPNNRLAVLWKHHNLHHFAGDDRAFGVSSPFWDLVYGTMPVDPRTRRSAGGHS